MDRTLNQICCAHSPSALERFQYRQGITGRKRRTGSQKEEKLNDEKFERKVLSSFNY